MSGINKELKYIIDIQVKSVKYILCEVHMIVKLTHQKVGYYDQ